MPGPGDLSLPGRLLPSLSSNSNSGFKGSSTGCTQAPGSCSPPHRVLLQRPPWQAGACPSSWGKSQEASGRHSGQNMYICLIFLLRSQCNDSKGIKQKAMGTTRGGKGAAQIPTNFWKSESGRRAVTDSTGRRGHGAECQARGKEAKMRSLGWVLVQYNWCPPKKRKFRHREGQTR